jgi:hypothetical protein
MGNRMTEEKTVGAIFVGVMAAIALVLAAGALIVSAGKPSALPGPIGDVAAAVTGEDAAPASLDVELSEFAIAPASLTVAEGGTLNVRNAGAA